jgi:hypothetical protein
MVLKWLHLLTGSGIAFLAHAELSAELQFIAHGLIGLSAYARLRISMPLAALRATQPNVPMLQPCTARWERPSQFRKERASGRQQVAASCLKPTPGLVH